MKVKFTNTLTQLKDKKVLFGTIIALMDDSFVIQIDGGGRCIVNPNSDYNFGFIPNEDADRKYAAALNRLVDEFDL
jgi:ABC-type proline/glycine betaine transport system ATPase subunit